MTLDIRKLNKPVIRLRGEQLIEGKSKFKDEIVDNSVVNSTVDGITSITSVDKDQILTFTGDVQIIITTDSNLPRMGGATRSLYQGKEPAGIDTAGDYSAQGPIVGQRAETYYSIGGKEPSRGKSYLYKYLDANDYVDSSNPSAGTSSTNINTLGFTMSMPQSSNDTVALKAKTFYKGNESDVALAYFRFVRPDNQKFDHTKSLT